MADNPLHEKLESVNPFYPAKNNMNPLDIDRVVQLIQQHAVNVVWEQAYHCPCLDEQTGQPQPNCPVCHGQGWIYLHPRTIDMAIQGDEKNFSLNPTGMDNLGTSKATPQVTVNGIEQGIKPGDRITVTGWTTNDSYTFNVTNERLQDGIFLPFDVASINEAYYIENGELKSIDDVDSSLLINEGNQLEIKDESLLGRVITLSLEVIKRFYVVSMIKELRYQQYYKLNQKLWALGNGTRAVNEDETVINEDDQLGNEYVNPNDMSSIVPKNIKQAQLRSYPQVVNRDGAQIVIGKHQIFRMPPTLLIRRENLYFSNVNLATSDGKNQSVIKDPTLNEFDDFLGG